MIELTPKESELMRKFNNRPGDHYDELSVQERVTYCVMVDRLLRTGPAHFREQAEAKAAESFGEDVAEQMVRGQSQEQ